MDKTNKYKLASTKKWMDKESAGFTQSFLKTPAGMAIYKPKVGKAILDVVPYVVGGLNPNADEGLLYWEVTFWVHKGIGPNQATFVCPARTLEQPCPVCEEKARIMKSNPNDEEFEAAKQLSPKEWQLIQIRDRNNKEKGIQLLPLSFHRFGDKIKDAIDAGSEADQWEHFWHPTAGGKILNVNWAEDSAGGGHKYVRAKTVIFTDRPQNLPDWLIDKGACLDELLIILDYEKLSALYSTGETEEEPAEEETPEEAAEEAPPEEEEAPKPARKPTGKLAAKPARRQAPPPLEEEEAPAEEEATEEEAPPEEEETPPEEEAPPEEEETPAPKKKVIAKSAAKPAGKPAAKAAKPATWDDFDTEEAPPGEEATEEEAPPEEEEAPPEEEEAPAPPRKIIKPAAKPAGKPAAKPTRR